MKLNAFAVDIELAKAALTRRELANLAEVSESLLSKACNGRSGISPKVAGRLARTLDVSVETIVELPEDRGVAVCK